MPAAARHPFQRLDSAEAAAHNTGSRVGTDASTRVSSNTRTENTRTQGVGLGFFEKAGEGARTLDIHLGKVALYH